MAAEPEKKAKKDKKEKKDKKDKKEKRGKESSDDEAPLIGNGEPKRKDPEPSAPGVGQLDIPDLKKPKVDEEAAQEVEDAFHDDDFWKALEGQDGGAGAGAGGESAPAKAVGLVASGPGRWEVPQERCDELMRKLEAVAQRSGASLVLQDTILRITGSPEERHLAERYARVVVDARVDEEKHRDVAMLSVSAEWLELWRGQEVDVEKDMDVLIVSEEPQPRATDRWEAGQVVEAQREGGRRWLMATVLGNAGPRKVRVRWSSDGADEEINMSHTRSTPRLGIFGSQTGRMGAQVSVLKALEAHARGSIAALLSERRRFGGACLASLELPVKPATMWKLENIPILSYLLQATGCMALELFMHPKSGGSGDCPCALLAGSREQRWQAGEILSAFAAGMDNRKLQGLPASLAGECRVLGVPKVMMGEFLGKAMSNLVRLMEATDSFVFPLREQAKNDQMDDLLNDIFESQKKQKQATSDIAIFGHPRARLATEVKVMVKIEAKYPGYYQPENGPSEVVDPAAALGIDRVWLSEDLEEAEGPQKRAEILAGAADCLVEAQGKLVLIGGSREARVRGREYLRLSSARRCNRRLLVPDLERRRDAVQLQVPQDISQNPWLLDHWEKLGLDTKTVIFYDGSTGDGTWDRLIVMGAVLTKRGKVVQDTLQQAKNLVEKTILWTKNEWDLSREVGVNPEEIIQAKLEMEAAQQASKGGKEGGKSSGKGKGKDGVKGSGKDKGKGKGKGKDEKGKGRGWEFLDAVSAKEAKEESKGKAKGKGKTKTKGKLKGKSQENLEARDSTAALKGAYSFDAKEFDVPSDPMFAMPGPVAEPSALSGRQDFVTAGAVGFGPHSNAAPQTPAIPLSRKRPVGSSDSLDSQQELVPKTGVAAPATPNLGGVSVAEGAKKQKTEAKAVPKNFKGAPPPMTAAVSAPKAGPPDQTALGFRKLSDLAPKPAVPAAAKPAVTAPPAQPAAARAGLAAPQTPKAGLAAPRTPSGARPPAAARVAGDAVAAPQTPALGLAAPQTPAGRPPASARTGGVAAPQTPAGAPPPASARVGGIAAPQTPAGARPPASARIPAPQTPGAGGLAAPQTPAGPGGWGLAAPQTPAGPASGLAAPQTPARPPAGPSGGGVPAPQTPAFEAVANGNFVPRSALLQAAARRPAVPPSVARMNMDPDHPDSIVPMTPARPGGNVVPQTPAVPFQSSVHSAAMPPSPDTLPGKSSPSTPAAITGRSVYRGAPPPASAALASPGTPAAITGRPAGGLGRSAPATPAAITGGATRAAPQTPAAIAGRGAPQSP